MTTSAAKKRARDIQYTRGRPERVRLYRELLKITRATLACRHQAALQLAGAAGSAVELWQAKVRHHRPLIEQIIAQTERRVPGSRCRVSLFEPHVERHIAFYGQGPGRGTWRSTSAAA